jgi:hypothetical protein
MRPRIAFLLLSVALALVSCAGPKRWAKPGATAEEFHRDSLDCARQYSARSAKFRPFEGYSDKVRIDDDLYRACLQARGYQRVEGGQWEGLD